MISNDLAEELAIRYARNGLRVLDPFCGTGRTLFAAAAVGALCTGTDVNPLACIITRAKAARVSSATVGSLATEVDQISMRSPWAPLNLRGDDSVKWFSRSAEAELSKLVTWINGLGASREELLVLAAVLSATTRDVSFARKTGWKLHRMSAEARLRHRPSARTRFARRLRSVAGELAARDPLMGTCDAFVADATTLESEIARVGEGRCFDLVLTSPPYGDSRTTVQYGGISKLCLRAVRGIQGLDVELGKFEQIDRRCLGGGHFGPQRREPPLDIVRKYWKGGRTNEARARVRNFLVDFEEAVISVGRTVRIGGRFVAVLGRRLAGGRRVYLDRFLADVLAKEGFEVEARWERKIGRKLLPWQIDSRARARQGIGGRIIKTMNREYIVVLTRVDSESSE